MHGCTVTTRENIRTLTLCCSLLTRSTHPLTRLSRFSFSYSSSSDRRYSAIRQSIPLQSTELSIARDSRQKEGGGSVRFQGGTRFQGRVQRLPHQAPSSRSSLLHQSCPRASHRRTPRPPAPRLPGSCLHWTWAGAQGPARPCGECPSPWPASAPPGTAPPPLPGLTSGAGTTR